MGFGAVVGAQECFDFRGFVVRVFQRDVTIHKDVELDGVMVADAASAQIVWLVNAGH